MDVLDLKFYGQKINEGYKNNLVVKTKFNKLEWTVGKKIEKPQSIKETIRKNSQNFEVETEFHTGFLEFLKIKSVGRVFFRRAVCAENFDRIIRIT